MDPGDTIILSKGQFRVTIIRGRAGVADKNLMVHRIIGYPVRALKVIELRTLDTGMCALTKKVEECCTLQRGRGFVERADLVLLSIGGKHFMQIRSYDKAGHLRNGQTPHNLLCLQIKNQNVAVSGNVCRIIKMKTMVIECQVIGYRACVCHKEQM